MLMSTNWACLCKYAQEAASFQLCDGATVVDNKEINCDFEIVDSNADTFEQLKRFLRNWKARTDEKAVIMIAGGGGSVYYANLMCNVLAEYIGIVSLTWGRKPICSAGHNYWYDWRLSSAWSVKTALLMLHSCTSGNNDDLRFYSLNVSAINSQHDSDSYGYLLSVNTNKYNPEPRPSGVRSFIRNDIWDAMQRVSYQGVGEKIDYVELFSSDVDGRVTSEVLPARAMSIDHAHKLVEELFEFNSAPVGTPERIYEGFDLVHTLMCALSCRGVLYTQNIMSYHSSNGVNIDSALSAEIDDAICKLAHELAQYSGWHIAGFVRNWEKKAIRRNRPVPVVSMFQFMNNAYMSGGHLKEVQECLINDEPADFLVLGTSLLFCIDELHMIDRDFQTKQATN